MQGKGMLAAMVALTAAGTVPRAVAAQVTELVVAATTDVHGRLRAWDYYSGTADPNRGLARLATMVDSVRAAHPGRVVLVDAGDLLQGNPLTYVAARVRAGSPHPVVAAMNAMRYDAAAIGNHEFNYGVPALRRALSQAHFPFLAANVRVLTGRGRIPFAKSRLVRRGGVTIGIVGATTPGAMAWDRDNLAGRLAVGDIVPAVRAEVASVRRRGASGVVVVMHSGLDEQSSYDSVVTRLPSENAVAAVARGVTGIDLIVYGHTHRELSDSSINGVLLLQPRNWATSLGVAHLTLERRGAGWRVTTKRSRTLPATGQPEQVAVVRAVRAAHAATVAWVNTTLGTTSVAWRADSARVVDSPITDFVLEVQRRRTGADLAATAAFDLNAGLDTGAITVAEVARLYPYENTLRAIRVTGRQLRGFLEHSARYYRTLGSPEAERGLVDQAIPGFNFDVVAGADYVLDIRRPPGQRVTRLEVRGRALGDGDTLTLALNNYRQTGGGSFSMLAGAPVVYDKGEEVRDLLIDEVRRRGRLDQADYHTANWRIDPAGIGDSLYRTMRSLPFERTTATGPAVAARSHLDSGRWLRIIGTNDIHGGLEPGDPSAQGVMRGGLAYLIGEIEKARRECRPPGCSSVWIDGGDQWQGTAASNASFGRAMVGLLNRFGLAASALGNHELDWGFDTLRTRLREARYQMMAANLADISGRDIDWVPDDTLILAGNVKVGVIGALTRETVTAARADLVAGFRFLDPAPIIDRRARALRERGAEVVVVAAHIGASCERSDISDCRGEVIELARSLTERVDAIVAGHLHRPAATIVNRVAITQAYTKGTAIGIIDLPLGGEASGRPRVSLRNVSPDSSPRNEVAAAMVDSTTAPVREAMARPVARIAEPIRRGANGTFGDLFADAFRAAGGADVAIMNQGGVRIDLSPGVITEGDVYEAAPFTNMLIRIRVRGSALLHYLERITAPGRSGFHLSGVVVELNPEGAGGPRVALVTMSDGRPLDPSAIYTMIMSDFLAAGGDGLEIAGGAISAVQTGIADRDALSAHLRSLPQPVRAPRERRVIRRP